MPHVVLLGDSVFDNAAYVPPRTDVVTQLGALLPEGWRGTLVALDGATTADLKRQAAAVPRDATHLVVSVGGNDALGHVGILERGARSVAEVLALLADLSRDFEGRYRAALAPVLALGLPTTVCTIYDGNFPDARLQRLASTALMAFNDPIVRVAAAHGLGLVDLRLVCSEPADYANPIEPSRQGGGKIARAVCLAVGALPTEGPSTRVTAAPRR